MQRPLICARPAGCRRGRRAVLVRGHFAQVRPAVEGLCAAVERLSGVLTVRLDQARCLGEGGGIAAHEERNRRLPRVLLAR